MNTLAWLFIGIATITYAIFETILILKSRKEGTDLDLASFITINIGILFLSALVGGMTVLIVDVSTKWKPQWTTDMLNFLTFLTICAVIIAPKIGLYRLSRHEGNIAKRRRKEKKERQRLKALREERRKKKEAEQRKAMKKKTR